MDIQILVSAVKKDGRQLAEKMNLQADSILVIQGEENRYEQFRKDQWDMRVYYLNERGVGLSRNTAWMRSEGEISLFSDEDIVYDDGAMELIKQEFAKYPQADMLFFNVQVTQERATYHTESFHPVKWYNCGRYPAYSIAVRTEKLRQANVCFPLLFGGGARYSNGEDSLFIHDCLKKGMKAFAVPVCIGKEVPRPSTWFHGYNEKFFYDRGVLYHFLYKKAAFLMEARFLYKNRNVMCQEIPFDKAWKLIRKGSKDAAKGQI